MSGTFDPLVVPGDQFAAVLQELIDYQDRERQQFFESITQHRGATSPAQPNGGRKWVADMVEVDPRRVDAVLEQQWVTLKVADDWLTKLGMSYLIDNGTLSIIPNPNMGIESWIAWAEERGHCI